MLRRHEQHAVGAPDLVLEARHLGTVIGFVILVVHRQIVDAHKIRVEFIGAELGERVGELAVDRIAAVAADDDGKKGFCHGAVLWLKSITDAN